MNTMTEQRQQAVTQAIDTMKSAIGAAPVSRKSLETVLQALTGLAGQTALWQQADYAAPEVGEHQARYLIADTDPSNTAALKFFTKKGFKDEREHVVLSLNLSRTERYRAILEKHGNGHGNGHGEADAKSGEPRRSKKASKAGQEKPLCGATVLEPES